MIRTNIPLLTSPLSSTFLLCFATLTMTACTSDEIGNSKDVNPDAVYFDYEISADETNPDVTINLQYRMGGKDGTTLVLNEPSKVLLDGEQLKVDSAKVTGAYYEIQRPAASFPGKHTITFTDLNKKEYKEEFEFFPFTVDSLPSVMTRGDLVFKFKGLDSVDYIDVALTDTSFASEDINETHLTITNGTLVIPAKRLSVLENGPIHVLFFKDAVKPVKNGTKEGGRILIRYGLRREFELRNASNP